MGSVAVVAPDSFTLDTESASEITRISGETGLQNDCSVLLCASCRSLPR